MPHIRVDTYYRMSHVTGSGCVLVSLKFGPAQERSPQVTIRASREAPIGMRMNVDAYVAEVIAGVRDANTELGTSIGVEEIEITPDDFPTAGQIRYCAKTLLIHYWVNVRQASPLPPMRALQPSPQSAELRGN